MPPLLRALPNFRAMSSTAGQLFAISDATELLHVPWHMLKLSFSCHSCTRSAVVCLQVAGTFRIHTCGGFDPPPPRTRSTGAPPQCRCVAHTPGLAGASTGQDRRLLRRTEMGEGEPIFLLPYLAANCGCCCTMATRPHAAAVEHALACHMHCISTSICHMNPCYMPCDAHM